jgi:FkbM family methyltransferase
MDLFWNRDINDEAPPFTAWAVANKLLREPFVVVDVGVQGGEHPRWKNLGEFAHVYGFDPIEEVIAGLNAARLDNPNRSYRTLAIGNEDGRRAFHVGAGTFESSFFSAGPSETGEHDGVLLGSRDVEIRRLDSLFAANELPPADYIKVDCEGFDPEVLRGARSYLAKSNVLCVTIESNFGISPFYPRTPFAEINDILVAHGLLVFDVNFVRTARPGYASARAARPWPAADPMRDCPDLDVGQPGTYDFVFCRDFVQEHTNPQAFAAAENAVTKPTVDKLIKSMINFELSGLMDCAVEIAEHFRPVLAKRFDVDTAVQLLLARPCYIHNTVENIGSLAMIAELRRQIIEMTKRTDMLVGHAKTLEHQLQQSHEAIAELVLTRRDLQEKLGSVRYLAPALVREIRLRIARRLGLDNTQ